MLNVVCRPGSFQRMSLDEVVETVGKGVDVAGILVIVGGAAAATLSFLDRARRGGVADAYPIYRRSLGHAILLGLEFLVAADIVRTVAITPTFSDVGVLGAIVVIRTFLSVALQVETEGRWPWRSREASQFRSASPTG
jgi:uncharacterized membrane protein